MATGTVESLASNVENALAGLQAQLDPGNVVAYSTDDA
jgi:hypothetical protein